MVDAQRFLKAFIGKWQHDLTHAGQSLRQAFQNDATRTAYMLDGEKAFLRRVAEADTLGLSMAKELLTVDAIYHDPKANLLPAKMGTYPNRLEVLIEHENGDDPEREMWKLLMLRAPLKVLIFYDWQKELQRTHHRQQWLTKKLCLMFKMGRAVDKQRPEAPETEYLLLVGKRNQQDDVPFWHYWLRADGSWPDPPGDGTHLT